jgi:hypothetical protein
MSKAKQLEQLEQECHTRGIKLIYDDLRSEGGLCRLRGCYYLILNRRLASETKARIILEALTRVPECADVTALPDRGRSGQTAEVSDRVPSAGETTPVVRDRPEPVYEEPEVGVPVTAGVPDSEG